MLATACGASAPGAIEDDIGLGLGLRCVAALLEQALPGAAALRAQPERRRFMYSLSRLTMALSEGAYRAAEGERERAREAAEHEARLAALAAQQRYIGSAAVPPRWSHLGWLQPQGAPLALAREGGQVILASGSVGTGKSQALLALLESSLAPRPGLSSATLPPTAAVVFHCDLTGVTLPELLHSLRPNDREVDRELLARSLWTQPAGLPRLRLVVPRDQVDDTYARVRAELGSIPAGLSILPLRMPLGVLGALGLEALLGVEPEDPPRYLQEVLAEAQELGERLTCQRLTQAIQRSAAISDRLKEQAQARLRLLARIEDPAADLWDLVEPGVLTVVSLSGRWLRRGEALPLIVALLNAFAQKSPRHGPFQRILAVDEINRLRGTPALWAALTTTARQIRHFGSLLWLSGQDLMNVPEELLALATQLLCFRLRSPKMFAHLQRHMAGLSRVHFSRVSRLQPGHALLVAAEASQPELRGRAHVIYVRPPACAHGGHTRAVL